MSRSYSSMLLVQEQKFFDRHYSFLVNNLCFRLQDMNNISNHKIFCLSRRCVPKAEIHSAYEANSVPMNELRMVHPTICLNISCGEATKMEGEMTYFFGANCVAKTRNRLSWQCRMMLTTFVRDNTIANSLLLISPRPPLCSIRRCA